MLFAGLVLMGRLGAGPGGLLPAGVSLPSSLPLSLSGLSSAFDSDSNNANAHTLHSVAVAGAEAGENCPRCLEAAVSSEPPPPPRRIIVPKGSPRGNNGSLFSPDAVNLPPNLLYPELQPRPALHSYLSVDSHPIPNPRECPQRYIFTNPWWYSRHHNNIISLQRAMLMGIYLNRTIIIDGGWRALEQTWEIRRMGWCVFDMKEWSEAVLGKRALPGLNLTAHPPGVPRRVMCLLWHVEGHGHCNNDFWDWPTGQPRPHMTTIRLNVLEVQTHHVHPYRHVARSILSTIRASEMDPATAEMTQYINMHFTYFTGVSKITSKEMWTYTRPSLAYRKLLVDMVECFFGQRKWEKKAGEVAPAAEDEEDTPKDKEKPKLAEEKTASAEKKEAVPPPETKEEAPKAEEVAKPAKTDEVKKDDDKADVAKAVPVKAPTEAKSESKENADEAPKPRRRQRIVERALPEEGEREAAKGGKSKVAAEGDEEAEAEESKKEEETPAGAAVVVQKPASKGKTGTAQMNTPDVDADAAEETQVKAVPAADADAAPAKSDTTKAKEGSDEAEVDVEVEVEAKAKSEKYAKAPTKAPSTASPVEDVEEDDGTPAPKVAEGDYKFPNYKYVAIHHRGLEGGCYEFGNKYPGSLNKTAMQRVGFQRFGAGLGWSEADVKVRRFRRRSRSAISTWTTLLALSKKRTRQSTSTKTPFSSLPTGRSPRLRTQSGKSSRTSCSGAMPAVTRHSSDQQ